MGGRPEKPVTFTVSLGNVMTGRFNPESPFSVSMALTVVEMPLFGASMVRTETMVSSLKLLPL